MTRQVADHYSKESLLDAIREGLIKQGLTAETVTVDDLAAVDEFHIGGRPATEAFIAQLTLSDTAHLLDIGCGLGGTARYVANTYGSAVTGIDVTADFIETGKALCQWVGLENRIELIQASALALPFEQETFDGAYMLHVGMNIKEKGQLCREIHRVLRPGAVLGIYDIVKMKEEALTYPLPWASHAAMSFVGSLSHYEEALAGAGFRLVTQRNRSDFALAFYDRLRSAASMTKERPALGLHLLMGASTKTKLQNMIAGLARGAIAPVEFVAEKR